MLAYIGLGSNLNNPKAQIEKALSAINRAEEVSLKEVSSFYESKPLLDMPGPNYINAVCGVDTSLSAIDLLDVCQSIEDDQKRVREVKWGSRTIDLDILLYEQQVISNERLSIPHPEIANRAFVLVPLHEIDKEIKVPLLGPVKKLVDRINTDDLKKL
ncbi:MAG: 2-amino-4-hydroxy-6-hydroxymethyldihydropteridine diphosphokinase [Candidatus Thioglobus sp.]|nr:2-amino-4-hydroxy-6-hydroxymethyldihydropteridine diphosphokinase [Candidatus Thioglobus sp.]